jgi:inner membrane protein
MYRDGHIGVALLGYAPVAYWLASADQMLAMGLGLAGVAAGCTLPDLDLQISGLKHRGMSHTFVAAAVIGIGYALIATILVFQGFLPVSATLINTVQAATFAFVIGSGAVVLHLIGDVLTPMGIRPWQPWSNREHTLELTTASNSRANEILFQAGSGAMVIALVLGSVGIGILSSIVNPILRVLTG